MPQVPLEIVGEIIEWSEYKYGCAQLKSCALVCRAWVPLAQKRIFHTLSLALDRALNAFQHVQRFLILVRTSPHIIGYVQNVWIRCWRIPQNGLKFHHFIHEPPVDSVLQILTHVKTLVLRSDRQPHTRLRWELLPERFIRSIVTLVSRPSFESLSLGGWSLSETQFMSLMKNSAPTLRNLTLDACSCDGPSTNGPIEGVEVPLLRRITLLDGSKLPFHQTLCMPNLHTFQCSLLHSSSLASSLLLPGIPPTIEHMHLIISEDIDTLTEFGEYTNLRHLSIDLLGEPTAIIIAFCLRFARMPVERLCRLETLTIGAVIWSESTWEDLPREIINSSLLRIVTGGGTERGALKKLILKLTVSENHLGQKMDGVLKSAKNAKNLLEVEKSTIAVEVWLETRSCTYYV